MARAVNLQTVQATIANGESLSGAIPVAPLVPIGIIMPASWTTAGLSFAVSVDDTNFYPLQDMSAEVTAAAAAGQYIALLPSTFIGIVSLKIRSGTAGSPVNQGAARTLILVSKV
jgi:hypothetical protein